MVYGVAKEPISTNSITEMHPVCQEDSSGQTRQDVKEKTAHISMLKAGLRKTMGYLMAEYPVGGGL